MFWYSPKFREQTLKVFSEKVPDMKFYPYDLIWIKSDGVGVSTDSKRFPEHVHESCLFGVRGGRSIVKIVPDSCCSPSAKNSRTHAYEKPKAMLEKFFSMLVDESTTLLDPTCGGGNALQVADSLGAAKVFGIEQNEDSFHSARDALKWARLLREAHKEL
jgi:2-polyprenyl-3-methyl-5-hydroxy-6-metoxy-1,4-benzoquinol methylase